jgi:hypothetical protein
MNQGLTGSGQDAEPDFSRTLVSIRRDTERDSLPHEHGLNIKKVLNLSESDGHEHLRASAFPKGRDIKYFLATSENSKDSHPTRGVV